jgi:hypothetical protein
MLELRKIYEGVVISRTIPGVGTITFDPNTTKKEHYINFSNLGFDFLYENVESNDGRKNGIKKKIESSNIDVIKKEVENYSKSK